MHLLAINPRIYEGKYHGTKTTYWKVKCELPNPSPENPGGKRTYQKKHATEAAAQVDRMRLIREYGGGSISAEQLRDYELANHRLDNRTTNVPILLGPARQTQRTSALRRPALWVRSLL